DKETSPARKIEYDRERMKLLDPADLTNIGKLEEEIKQHEREITELEKKEKKKVALVAISQANQEGRSEDALRLANDFAKEFPDEPEAKDIVARIEAPLLVDQAIDILIQGRWKCDDCQRAKQMVDRAVQLSPDLLVAERMQGEIDSHLQRCVVTSVAGIILFVLLLAGLFVGLYFLLRPGKWALEVLAGPGKGQIFPLDHAEMVIGALGQPDGEADIVICDDKRRISRRHCSIRLGGRSFYLQDESANGTRVNGQPIGHESRWRLRKGDEIALADEAVLLFRPQ